MKKAVILGANGNIGKYVSMELANSEYQLIQFSRKPKKINHTDILFAGDILDSNSVHKACEGADLIFLLVGIQYSSKAWTKQWPVIMRNTLDASIANQAKLVFFDNMYALNPEEISHLTEKTALEASSNKGKIRKQILEMLWSEVASKKLKALVARSADFYGPGASNSMLNEMVISKMKSGKKPQWLYSASKKHSFTYVPDAGKATAFLALQEDSWNQAWNLPTDSSYPSLEEIVRILNEELGSSHQVQVMPAWLISVLSLFMSILKEVKELRYQLDQDYCFDSKKIQQKYGIYPTPIREGLKNCLR
jgi:nucleoside-diphosphate-sugar epimerase